MLADWRLALGKARVTVLCGLAGLTLWLIAPDHQRRATLANPAPGQPDTVLVIGTVVDSAGAAIRGAEVTLLGGTETTVTSAGGEFRLTLPTPGRYSVQVRRIGYQPLVRTISVAGRRTIVEPIVLYAAPQALEDLRVEGHTRRPVFNLRATTYLARAPTTRRGKHASNLTVWETRGASLSPWSVLIALSATYGDFAALRAWEKDAGGAVTDLLLAAVGCPAAGDPIRATGWIGWTDTMRLMDWSGRSWKRQMIWWNPPGPCIQTAAAPSEGKIVNAAAVAGGWMVVHAASAGQCRLLYQADDGQAYWQLPADRLGSDCAGLTRAHLTPILGGAAVALSPWPFTWVRVDLSGRVTGPFEAAAAPGLPGREQLRDWASLGVLDLGDGFAQTLISPGARERVIVVYDKGGRAVATTQAQGAPALIASDPAHRRLLGLRFTSAGRGRSEIVVYEY